MEFVLGIWGIVALFMALRRSRRNSKRLESFEHEVSSLRSLLARDRTHWEKQTKRLGGRIDALFDSIL